MAAIDDLKASQAAITQAVLDAAAELKNLAAQVAGLASGVTVTDAEAVATAINAQATALEAAVKNPAGV